MALSKGVNSYVDAAEADTYFTDRLDTAAWDAASAEEKDSALITATSMLENINWTGIAVDNAQLLSFPRTGTYFEPRVGSVIDLDGVPLRIEKATMELSYHLLNNDGLLDDTGSVVDIEIDVIKLKEIRSVSKIPSTVSSLIKPLKANGGSNSWWRSN